jgi:hypothetical protein
MAIQFKTKEAEAKTLQLLRDSGSTNKSVADAAQEAFASIMSSSLSRVLEPLNVANDIFTEVEVYTGRDVPEIPIDLYYGVGEGAFRVWSNGYPGGLAYNEISGFDSFRFRTSRMDSAIAWNKSYAADARMKVVERGLMRLMDEIMVKSQFNAFTVLADALGSARTANQSHVIASTAKTNSTARQFQLDDVNRLMTKIKRLNSSWANGTSRSAGSGLTDLYISPETMEQIRKMTYNPMNTTGVPDSAESTALGLPDEMRMEIYRNGGATEIYGKTLHELNEMGVGQVYNELFRQKYNAVGGGAPAWTVATDELVIGIDKSLGAFARVINADTNGSTFQLLVDDQHLARSEKMGYYGFTEEGWLVGLDKAIVGLLW